MLSSDDEKKIAQSCVSFFSDLRAVYLFGSQVTEYARKDSDIDIAVLCERGFSAESRWDFSQGLAILLNRDIDVVDLKQASTVMQWQIVRTGKRILCVDEKEINFFETYVFSDYIRLNELRQGLLDDIKKRGSVYFG